MIGASVSAGFSSPPVATSFAAAAPASAVTNAASLWMFRDADASGATQVDAAVAAKPTLVLAIDFLFWFAYTPGDEATRLASLDRGLALLERVDAATALAVGDVPDMRDADPRMLPVATVPTPAQLVRMNARVHAWAATRPRAIVLPLAERTRPLLEGGTVELAPGETIDATSLLFVDRLHPNPLGLWYLLRAVDGELETRLGAKPDAAVFARP